MKMRPMRRAAVTVGLCLALSSLFSCSKKSEAQVAEIMVIGGEETRSGVYRGEAVILPEGWSVRGSGRWDPEMGQMSVLGVREGGNGRTEYALLLLSGDGALCEAVSLPTEEEADTAALPRDTGRFVFYVQTRRTVEENAVQSETVLCRLDRESGNVLRSGPVDGYYPANARWADVKLPFSPSFLDADTDGDVILADQLTAVVFTADFTVKARFALSSDGSEGEYRAVGTGRGGRFRCLTRGAGWVISVLDKESGERTEDTPLDVPAGQGPDAVHFALPGSDFDLWFSDREGLYGGNIGNGGVSLTLLMQYEESGIDRTDAAQEPVFFGAADTEHIWILAYGESGWEPVLYQPAGGSGAAAVTLEIAHTVPLTAGMRAAVRRFGADKGIAVRIRDYSAGDSSSGVGGETGLAEDMAKGAVRPDLIVGSSVQDEILSIAEKGWTADLGPWLDEADFIPRGDVFGAVLAAFSTEDGAVWGLPQGFYLHTLVAAPDFDGAPREGWDTEEALDWLENLPDGCEGMPDLCGEDAPAYFACAYMDFTDAREGTCSFDSALFLRFLRWLRTLPLSRRTWESLSSYAAAIRDSDLEEYRSYESLAEAMRAQRERTGEGDAGEIFRLRTSGIMPVLPFTFYTIQDIIKAETLFDSSGWRDVGYPAACGGTAEIGASRIVMIAAETEHSALCRELAVLLLTDSGESAEIPAFRSAFRREAGELENSAYRYVFEGGKIVSEDAGIWEEVRDKPGFDLHPAEDFAHAEQLFDGRAVPLLGVRREVTVIVEEELSSYISGTGALTSPERCAEKIRSRVSILLGERR